MNFFTLDWWSPGCPTGVLVRYWFYVDAIRPRLSPDLARLADEVSLHDAKLRILTTDVAAQRLDLHLDGYRYDERGTETWPRHIRLTYLGLRRFESTADPERGLGGPHGYGDLGYDEVDVRPDGSFEHRLLFSSGIEMTLQFEAFRLDYQDVAGP